MKKLLTLALGLSLVGMPAVAMEKKEEKPVVHPFLAGLVGTFAGAGVVFAFANGLHVLSQGTMSMNDRKNVHLALVMVSCAAVVGLDVTSKVSFGKKLNAAEKLLLSYGLVAYTADIAGITR